LHRTLFMIKIGRIWLLWWNVSGCSWQSKEVRFAAVADTNGKLIAGKQCKDDKINNSLGKTRLFQLSSTEAKENRQNSINSTATFCHYNTNYIFYTNYLASILKRIKNDMQCSDNKEWDSAHRIELVQIHGFTKNSYNSTNG
jgi:hypothetical protein